MNRTIAVVVAATLMLGGCSRDGGDGEVVGDEPAVPGAQSEFTAASRTEARARREAVLEVKRGHPAEVGRLIAAAGEWIDGKRTATEVGAMAAALEPKIAARRDAIAGLRPPSFEADVQGLDEAGIRLDLEAVRIYEVATALDPLDPALRGQLHLLARRVGALAEDVSGRAGDLVGAHIRGRPAALGGPVPEWTGEGLAPGAPLAEVQPPAPGSRSSPRRERPFGQWRESLEKRGITNALTLADAIDARDVAGLREEAAALTLVARQVGGEPSPAGGGRLLAGRVQLALLVHAEAAQSALAATAVADPGGADALASIARRIAAAGDMAWPVVAGIRSTGFPADAEEGE